MDCLNLSRRPLVTLSEQMPSVREPQKKDRVTNRLRAIADRFRNQRRYNRAGYNRKERARYHSRLPQRNDPRHRFNRRRTSKRLAPEKRLGVGRLRQR